jgi:hypothetical protein
MTGGEARGLRTAGGQVALNQPEPSRPVATRDHKVSHDPVLEHDRITLTHILRDECSSSIPPG